jgi:hypothetical protein
MTTSATSTTVCCAPQRLTLIATVFLPLTFVTGFFGQNFGWLVGHINGFGSFLAFGVGGVALPALVMVVAFGRAGWPASPAGGPAAHSGSLAALIVLSWAIR